MQGNISMGAAYSKDLVHWTDYHSWKDPVAMWPSQLYDIAGVFDGTIIPEGWNGHVRNSITHSGILANLSTCSQRSCTRL